MAPNGSGNVVMNQCTATTVPIIDASKNLVSSATTPTELGFVHNVTSSLCGINQTCTEINKTINGSSNTFSNIPLSTAVTGTLAIANGGTGQTAANAALNALLPTQTSANGFVLGSNGTNSSWVSPPSGGSKNYLSAYTASLSSGVANAGNGNAELGAITGWSLGHVATITNGLPSGTITFGSGAAGTLSLTATNSNPLSQNWSFSYASSAATTAGDFLASNAFFIDASDQGKVLTWKFSYSTITGSPNFSGTSANSFAVAIWDVGSSAFISSTGNFNLIQGSGVGIATGTFQTNTTTSQYRIVIYNATATPAAATMYFDDISVGPQTSPTAPAISDAKATVIVYENFGTVTANNAFSRRVGDRLEVWGTVTPGTTVAALAAIDIPSLTIDSTKISSSALGQAVGTLFVGTAGANNIPGTTIGPFTIFYDGSTTSKVFIAANSNASILSKGNASGLSAGSTNPLSYYFSVPIAGWSSNSVSSSDTDTRVIDFIGNQASQAVTANVTDVAFTAVTDRAAAWNGTQYKVGTAGDFVVSAQLNPSASCGMFIYKNGSAYQQIGGAAAGGSYMTGTYTVTGAVPGDLISIRTNVSTTVIIGSLAITRVSGPAVITLAESVAMQVTTSATLSTTSGSPLVFTVVEKDTHNKYSAGSYPVPMSGWYKVSFSGMLTTATIMNFTIFKNGTAYRKISGVPNTTASAVGSGSVGIQCNVGDILTLVPDATTTLLYSAGLYQPTWTVERQGN